jgi:hypothetical protein
MFRGSFNLPQEPHRSSLSLRHLWKMRLVSSTVVFIAIAAPWHILAALGNPAAGQSKGFLWFYFVNE